MEHEQSNGSELAERDIQIHVLSEALEKERQRSLNLTKELELLEA